MEWRISMRSRSRAYWMGRESTPLFTKIMRETEFSSGMSLGSKLLLLWTKLVEIHHHSERSSNLWHFVLIWIIFLCFAQYKLALTPRCSIFVSSAKRLRVLKSSELSAADCEPIFRLICCKLVANVKILSSLDSHSWFPSQLVATSQRRGHSGPGPLQDEALWDLFPWEEYFCSWTKLMIVEDFQTEASV